MTPDTTSQSFEPTEHLDLRSDVLLELLLMLFTEKALGVEEPPKSRVTQR